MTGELLDADAVWGYYRPIKHAASTQLTLSLDPSRSRRGGRRPGAGRKPRPANARRPLVPHRRRPEHVKRHPVHVTLSVARGLVSFRSEKILKTLERVLDDKRGDDFQVVHFSIQADHVHLIVEAEDKPTLSSGMRRVVIALARRVNEVFGRKKGKIWGDRYHRRDLATPREVKNALVYLFSNAAKHGEHGQSRFALDRFSSATAFDGWAGIPRAMMEAFVGTRKPWKPPRPRTWLLGFGWKKIHGPIVLGIAARGAR